MTTLETAFERGMLAAGERIGIGGSSWTIVRASGNGVTGARSSASHSITGSVSRSKKVVPETASPNVFVQAEVWLLTCEDSQDVQIGDVVTSAMDSALVYGVTTRQEEPGYLLCELAPKT